MEGEINLLTRNADYRRLKKPLAKKTIKPLLEEEQILKRVQDRFQISEGKVVRYENS